MSEQASQSPPGARLPIHQQMVFAAELATINQVSTSMLTSSRWRHACSVDTNSMPHDLVVLTAPSQNRLVDMLPDANSHPFLKPTPACHATAAAEFARQVLPQYGSFEDKQDSSQGRRIIDTGRLPFGDR